MNINPKVLIDEKEMEPPSQQVVPQTVTSDELLQVVGPNNRFQIRILLFSWIVFISNGMLFNCIQYLEKMPDSYFCNGVECSRQQACQLNARPAYISHYTNFITQYQMQCASQGAISLIGSLYFAGFLIGAVLFPRLADIVGRKKLEIIGCFCQTLVALSFFFCYHSSMLYVTLFLFGLKTPMTAQVPYLHMMEFIGSKSRNKYSTYLFIGDGIPYILLPIYWKIVPNFRPLFIFNAMLYFFIAFLIMFQYPESARYYVTRTKFQRARAIFQHIASVNYGTTNQQHYKQACEMVRQSRFRNEIPIEIQLSSSSKSESPQEIQKPKTSLKDLIKHGGKEIFIPLSIMCYCWFVATFVNYGTMFGLKYVQADLFLTSLVFGIAYMVGYMTLGVCAGCFGRKKTIFLQFFLSGIFFIIYQFIHTSLTELSIIAFIWFQKLFAEGGFGMVYLMTSEIFPTAFRATVFGIVNFFARIGGIIVPYVNEVAKNTYMLIFAILSFVAAVLCFFLPETKNSALHDNLEELNSNQREKSSQYQREEEPQGFE